MNIYVVYYANEILEERRKILYYSRLSINVKQLILYMVYDVDAGTWS